MRSFFRIVAITLLLCTLTGCHTSSRDQIAESAKSRITAQETASSVYDIHFGYQKDLGKWLDMEKEYLYDPDGDASDGITKFNTIGMIHVGERLYFPISKQTPLSTGDNFYAYVSTKTGEKHYICPDPLCGHDEESGCPYINFDVLAFPPDSDSKIYGVRTNIVAGTAVLQDRIYEIDLSENKLRQIYNSKDICKDFDVDYITMYFIIEDTLYFTDRFVFYEEVEGERIVTERTWLLGLNLKTKETAVLNDHFDENLERFHVIGDRIFYTDLAERTVYCTDFAFTEKTPVLQYPDGYQLSIDQYDSNTGELYMLVTNSELHQAAVYPENPNAIKCTLYCVDSDLQCKEVPMPSDQLIDFQLTNEYIYYRKYDPINFKTPPYERNAIDVFGNKLYRVKRSDTMTPEVAFDGHEELFFRDYFVTGDYLYFAYYALVIREEGQVFRRMGATARVNMKENTIKWLNLD